MRLALNDRANGTSRSEYTDFKNISFADSEHLKVDIPIKQTTLFKRVFMKGGKINNE